MKIRDKNNIFQSCRYCCEGGSSFLVETDVLNEIFYVCNRHRQEKDELKNLIKELSPEKERND